MKKIQRKTRQQLGSGATSMTLLYLVVVSALFCSSMNAGPPGSDGTPSQDMSDWSVDSTARFPENTPLSMTGRWQRLHAACGPPNLVWIWEDPQSQCNINLLKIPANEGESLEEVTQLYARSSPPQPVKTNQTQLSPQAIFLQKTPQTGKMPSTLIKLLKRGPSIWMLSGSWLGKEECNWCQDKIPNYANLE